ncbi:WSC domain-containing protein 1-like [Lytechinus variegatus]|uniref:WSC domain-containing protein 1-like n=1 Tax=Lytechinus variegatus TaxID=7654 RepID=UPI001BB17C3A|nr:WSC domain-containing protein 1-like [Lytechinus variegatus]
MKVIMECFILVASVTVLGILLEYFSTNDAIVPCSTSRKLLHAYGRGSCRMMIRSLEFRPANHTDFNLNHMVTSYVRNASRILAGQPKESSEKDVSYDVCQKATLVTPHSYPLTALASFPGSGNTWVRYLLERASGFYTGSVYYDKGLYNGGFKGEPEKPEKGTTLIVKTHEMRRRKSYKMFEKAVLIVRNPYDCLLAYANFNAKGHTGFASRKYFKSHEWDNFVEKNSQIWENTIASWIALNNTLLVFYEDLQSELCQQITRILKFLGVPLDEERLSCTEAYPQGRFRRNKTDSDRLFDPYTKQHETIIKTHIDAASKLLLEKGYISKNLTY